MSHVMQQDQPPLLDAIEAFLDDRQMAPVTFGRKALSDPHFVGDLRNGRRVWPETDSKVREFMANYPPSPSEPESAAA